MANSNDEALLRLLTMAKQPLYDNTPTVDLSKTSPPILEVPQFLKSHPIRHSSDLPVRDVGVVKMVPPQPAEGEETAADLLYRALNHAEMQGQDDHWIRTKSVPRGTHSTAYGPVQLTANLAKGFRDQHSDLFEKDELEYLDRFIAQGQKFKKAKAKDSTYGYGGSGDLTSDTDKMLYDATTKKMVKYYYDKYDGDPEAVWKAWRFGEKAIKNKAKKDKTYRDRFYSVINGTAEDSI